jgi:colanic acid/amylovoran biosynthesis glycosyltransferase
MDLILITISYPYTQAAEQTFLDQEIPFLVNSFRRIFIIPQITKGEEVHFNNVNIIIDEEYSHTKSEIIYKNAVTRLFRYDAEILKLILKEIWWKPSILFNAKKALAMLVDLQQSVDFFWYINKFISKNDLNLSQSIFYTYWFQSTTMGLTLLRKKFPKIKIVTRAHNADLFEERYPNNYIPFRRIILKEIDAVFPCMQFGSEYMNRKYNIDTTIIKTSYLGVDDYGIINHPSKDGVFRIVSCSSIIPLKRLNLIVLGIQEIVKLRPKKKIEWLHFGDGELRNNIEKLVGEVISEKVSIELKGQVTLNQIVEHYKNRPVDVFINVSSYEGQPVSIKEAISFGIPIIATNVGGNSEIVSKENGILLNANPTSLEIAKSIHCLMENNKNNKKMRINSRRLFLEKYDSKIVYPNFILNIKNIVNNIH